MAAQNTLMGDGSAPALGQHPSCPLQPPVWMRGYRVRAEAALIGPILPSGLYLSLLGSSFSPSTFAKPGSSSCALRSLQKKSSLNPRYCPLPLTAFSDHCPFLVSLSLSLSFLPDGGTHQRGPNRDSRFYCWLYNLESTGPGTRRFLGSVCGVKIMIGMFCFALCCSQVI